MGRILGLDVGDKTIGVAVSDELGWTAQGVMTVQRQQLKADLHAILELVATYAPTEILIGLPKNMNNTLGEQAEKTQAFAKALASRLAGIPIKFWDERLSTATARQVLIEADVRRKKRKTVVNTLAAVVILQSYLDAQASA
jgi:putative holliday junction resolvase